MKNQKAKFEVDIFKSDVHGANPVEMGLPFNVAVKKAKEMWESGKYYGVAVIDQTPNCPEPIQWLKSNSTIIENIDLAKEWE